MFTLVADQTQDMGLMPVIIDGVAHGLAVDSKALIVVGIGLVPALQGSVKVEGIDPDQNVTDDVFTGNDEPVVIIPAPEPSPGILAEAFCPIGDCSVSAHPTQTGPSGNGQDSGESMTTPLSPARIGDFSKKGRKGLHLVSIEHHFGTSCTIGWGKNRFA